MRVIDKIAQLILQDPYITAKNIARKLGYAEEKTVYYWIDKSHFKGLTAFKRAVINKQFQPGTPFKVRESRVRYGRVPVISGTTAEGHPISTGDTMPAPSGSKAHWVWAYPGPALPGFLVGDWIWLAPFDARHGRAWALAIDGDHHLVLRAVFYDSDIVRPVDPASYVVDRASRLLFSVTELTRSF